MSMNLFRRKLTAEKHRQQRLSGALEGAEYHKQVAAEKRDLAAWALAQAEGHALMEAVYRNRMKELDDGLPETD